MAKNLMTHLSTPCVGGERLEQPLNSETSWLSTAGRGRAQSAALSTASAPPGTGLFLAAADQGKAAVCYLLAGLCMHCFISWGRSSRKEKGLTVKGVNQT